MPFSSENNGFASFVPKQETLSSFNPVEFHIRRTSPNQVVFSMKIYYFLQKCSHFRSQTFLSHLQVSTIMWLAIQLPNQFGTITTIFVGDNFGFTFRYNLSNLCLCLATLCLEQLQLSLLGTTSASPLDLICQICAFVWPPPVR